MREGDRVSYLQRAILAIRRKRGRSLIVFAIMTLIFSALIGESIINKTTKGLKQNLDQNFRAGFTVESRAEGLDLNVVEKIAKLEDIEKTNWETMTQAAVEKYKLVPVRNRNIEIGDFKNKNETGAEFLKSSSLLADFLSGQNEIKTGRHIEEKDEDVGLIHEKFAQLNGLKVGDEIEILSEGKKIKIKLVGIFTGKDRQQVVFPAESIENRLYLSFKTLQKIKSETKVQVASYFVKDPKHVEQTIAKTKQMKLDWDKMSITNNFEKNTETYQAILNIEKMLKVLLMLIAVFSVLIMGLVLMFWFRGRIHEMGTLLAIGKTKTEVFLQLMVELSIIACLSFLPAILVGNVTSNQFLKIILEQASLEQTSNIIEGLNLSVNNLGIVDYMKVYIMGVAVILLSIGGSAISTFRLTPKQILSKMK